MKKIVVVMIFVFTLFLMGCATKEEKESTIEEIRKEALNVLCSDYSKIERNLFLQSELKLIDDTFRSRVDEILSSNDKDIIMIKSQGMSEYAKRIREQRIIKIGKTPVSIYMSNVYEHFDEGDGSYYYPFIVKNASQLEYLAKEVNAGNEPGLYYALGNDIDLNNRDWTPIGCNEETQFSGTFDGRGFVIKNISFYSLSIGKDNDALGLFGFNDGIIRNLGLVSLNVDIKWNEKQSLTIGGICGVNNGIIENSYVIGEIDLVHIGDFENKPLEQVDVIAAGIAGASIYGIIYACYSMVDIDVKVDGELYGTAIITSISYCHSLQKKYTLELGELRLDGGSLPKAEILDNRNFSEEQINDKDYYINQLKWDTNIWNLDNICFQKGKFLENQWPTINHILTDSHNGE